MKENYENITCEIVMFETADNITTSTGTIGGYGGSTHRIDTVE